MKNEMTSQRTLREKLTAKYIKQLVIHTITVALLFALATGINYYLGFNLRNNVSPDGQGLETHTLPLSLEVLVVLFVFVWLAGMILIVWRFWIGLQNDRISSGVGYDKDSLVRAIRARYQKNFWVSFALYSVVMLLAILAFFMIKDSRLWYADDPWYILLATMRNLFPLMIVLIWTAGAVVLLFIQWRRSSLDIIELINSIEQMQTSRDRALIVVPRNLQEIQPLLQSIYDKALDDRLQAEEAERRKNELVLYLAHDLKTPLTSVVGYLSLLEESEGLSEERRDHFVHIAKQKALKLETLIEQFFEISRYNFRDFELRKREFDLELMLIQLVEELYPFAKEQEKEVELSVEAALSLSGDVDMLARAFGNVLKNALAYSAAKSSIQMRAFKNDDSVCIRVMNKGSTIPPEQKERVFEKFYRLDPSRTTHAGGSGLGLAITKEIIEWHSGTIEVESALSQTTFTITLPLQTT